VALPERLPDELLQFFPNLKDSEEYNCFAWAAGDTSRKWAPVDRPPYYWPQGVPKGLTVDSCIKAYETLGFRPCETGELEIGQEKIAIFVHEVHGRVTHAARQLPDGCWTSKLGDFHDIKHKTLRALECPDYGRVARFLRRDLSVRLDDDR
jgi:hypothetical protein